VHEYRRAAAPTRERAEASFGFKLSSTYDPAEGLLNFTREALTDTDRVELDSGSLAVDAEHPSAFSAQVGKAELRQDFKHYCEHGVGLVKLPEGSGFLGSNERGLGMRAVGLR
jgi:hypothetical protein